MSDTRAGVGELREQDNPMVTVTGIFTMQACVPAHWNEEQVADFGRRQMCGTTHGWQLAHDGDEVLSGAAARVPCAEREGYVHVIYECRHDLA
ncbi:MAG: hypothetical protein ACYC3L_01185 [Gemmatimonadaceae bacterium]